MKTFTRTDQSLFTLQPLNLLHLLVGRLIPAAHDEAPFGLVTLQLRLREVCRSDEDRQIHEQIFRFIFYMLLPPPEMPAMQTLHKPVDCLLNQLCTIGEVDESFRIQLLDSTQLLFNLLEKSPSTISPDIESRYPLYYLHLCSWADHAGDIRASYRRYALTCHWHLAQLMNRYLYAQQHNLPHRDASKQSEEYDTALALRHFLIHCPTETASATDVATRPTPQLLWTAYVRGLYTPSTEIDSFKTVTNHFNAALNAFRYRHPQRRGSSRSWPSEPRLPKRLRHACSLLLQHGLTMEPLDEISDDDRPEGFPQMNLRRERHYPPNMQQIIDVGESLDEHATTHLTAEKPATMTERPLMWRLYRRHLGKLGAIAQSHRFFWDQSTLSVSTFTAVLDFLIQRYEQAPTFAHLSELTYVVLIMLTGQNPDRVAAMQFAHEDSIRDTACNSGTLFFDVDHHCLAYLVDPDILGYYRGEAPEFSHQCHQASPIIYIPLAPLACGFMKLYLERRSTLPGISPELQDYVFLSDTGGTITRLSSDDVAKLLSTTLRSPTEVRVTLARLARSAYVHATTQLNLDPVLACYWSGRVPLRYKAQLFYTYIPCQTIWTKCARIGQQLGSLIWPDSLEKGQLIRAREAFSHNFVKQGWDFTPIFPKSFEGVGSRCVMTDEALRTFVSTFDQKLNQLEALVAKHPTFQLLLLYFNLSTIKNYIQYQFGTGLRPLKDPPVNQTTIRLTPVASSRIIIRDKNSGRFAAEPRAVPHAPSVHAILLAMKTSTDRLRTLLNKQYCPIDEWLAQNNNPYFFIIREEGSPTLLSLAAIRECLSSVDELALLYLVPLNAPRHYLRSSMLASDFSSALIDHIFGHSHEGYEPLSILAATQIAEAESRFIDHIEGIFARLGFRPAIFKLPEDF